METTRHDPIDFFLGATTPAGFKGYFEPLRREPGMQMYLIKSGPGCGKSTLMKRLARAAEQNGLLTQTNRNLCATREARMYSKPQLEIYADDVKCSHGMTTGQLDENALFYMQSRGIPRDEARMLLSVAFTSDVIDHVRLEALKDRLHKLVEKRFRGELAKCAGCRICK